MNIKLDIKVGEYRDFTDQEFKELQDLLEDSEKTAPENN